MFVLGMTAAALGLLGTSSSSSNNNNGDGESGAYCATFEGKARQCGLLGTGRTNCFDYFDAAESCEIQCIKIASCAELTASSCAGTGPLSVCLGKCVGLQPVNCTDGTVLTGYARCDGIHSCGADDDQDESGCTQTGFKCRNVDQYVDESKRCDHHKDCSDGSDETPECDVVATCLVGGTKQDVLGADVCNAVPLCDDHSDEPSDCAAPLLCPGS